MITLMKDISIGKVLQDISAIIGSLLPIAQLFFSQWVYAFDKVFLAKEQFMGISIVTLVLSYVFIIAYLAKPYDEIVMPFQAKKRKKLQNYWNERPLLEAKLRNISELSNVTVKQITKHYNELIDLKQPEAPLKVDDQNRVKVIMGFVIVTSITFVFLVFIPLGGWLVQSIQAISYILLIVFSALMLTIYKSYSDNNNNWVTNNRTRANKAIKLAIDANGFGNLPQVTFVSQNEINGFTGQLNVKASFNDELYSIVTDREAQFLISVSKAAPQLEDV
jgi:hypothetical protein